MIITIKKPLSFNELGKRENQEDYRWPLPEEATADGRVFIVCDGVGGHEGGEVASFTVANSIGSFLGQTNWNEQEMTPEIMTAAINYAYDELDKVDNGAERKMATTLTCIVLHRGGVYLAHMGDSRIYQVRPNETGQACVEYVTQDHSVVNDLLRLGEITPEEAVNHPHKNQITRCLMPNQDRRCKASVYNITDVRPGDYFFLCTDGVLENLTQNQLGKILSRSGLSNEQKLDNIKDICFDKTRDNHTCYLIQIDSMVKEANDVSDESDSIPGFENLPDAPASAPELVLQGNVSADGNASDTIMDGVFSNRTNRLIIIGCLVLLILMAGIFVGKNLFSGQPDDKPAQPVQQVQRPPVQQEQKPPRHNEQKPPKQEQEPVVPQQEHKPEVQQVQQIPAIQSNKQNPE